MTNTRHFTDIATLDHATFEHLMQRSLDYRATLDAGDRIAASLSGKLQFNLFYENSTRTILSFDVAGRRLGATVCSVPVAASSTHKGESHKDTVLTLCAQGADFLVIRAKAPGSIQEAIDAVHADGYRTSVINGGEGAIGHPSQGLLDVGSVLHALNRTPSQGLSDKKLVICGDIVHSRVAASAIEAFARLGARIDVVGPASMLPLSPPAGVSHLSEALDDALPDADLVMTLRIQKERMETTPGLTDHDYHATYGLSHERMRLAKDGALILHPGPMNRGIEITDALADDLSVSLIRSQVTQGVAVRMAILEWLNQAEVPS